MNKNSINISFKKAVRRLLARIINFFMPIIFDEFKRYERIYIRFLNDKLLASLQSCGSGVVLNGQPNISDPRSCILGNNVHIGENAFFKTEGGLVIGDNSHISRNVVIYTVNHNYDRNAIPFDADGIHKPVLIGKNVWIGMNVSIVPGVVIGEGAIIGLGSVVTKNVAAGDIVGGAPAISLKSRNKDIYEANKLMNHIGSVNGVLLTDSAKNAYLPHARELGGKLFFILTTGRSGSTSIAVSLSKHPDINCFHEPRTQLIRLSTEYAHKTISREELLTELTAIFDTATYNGIFNGESDQKLFNLIDEISNILPEAKFIWLIRDAKEVVASATARNWFSDNEYNPNASDYWLNIWQKYRLNGFLCGEFSKEQWSAMSVFERNCWYWKFVNETIEKKLANIADDRKLKVTLSELNEDIGVVFDFLGASRRDVIMSKVNRVKAGHNLKDTENWSKEEWEIYEKYCAEGMNKWYL